MKSWAESEGNAMTKWGVLLLGLSGAALAQDQAGDRIPAELRHCVGIERNTERLACFDRGVGSWATPVITFGRVPLFFYLLHLPLIHALCVLAAWWQAGSFPAWLFHNPPLAEMPADFGYGLPVVYAVWLFVVAALYSPCRWYAGVKQRVRSQWLSYL